MVSERARYNLFLDSGSKRRARWFASYYKPRDENMAEKKYEFQNSCESLEIINKINFRLRLMVSPDTMTGMQPRR